VQPEQRSDDGNEEFTSNMKKRTSLSWSEGDAENQRWVQIAMQTHQGAQFGKLKEGAQMSEVKKKLINDNSGMQREKQSSQ